MAGAVCSLIIALLLCLLWGSGLWVRRRDASQPDRSAATAKGTITTWLARAGEHSTTLHDRWVRHLTLLHLQLDELRTRQRDRAHVLWRWVALDPLSKLVPVLHLGVRTQHTAHGVVHELCQRLAPDCLPVFTSDGLNLYFYALTAHFGTWVAAVGQRACHWQVMPGLIYGQVKRHSGVARWCG